MIGQMTSGVDNIQIWMALSDQLDANHGNGCFNCRGEFLLGGVNFEPVIVSTRVIHTHLRPLFQNNSCEVSDTEITTFGKFLVFTVATSKGVCKTHVSRNGNVSDTRIGVHCRISHSSGGCLNLNFRQNFQWVYV